MKILIIEGIATSGKSSLIKQISSLLSGKKVRVYGESETHEPIMHKPDQLHLGFFEKLLRDAAKSDAELVIFDRFHFTQAFRAGASLDQYETIEQALAKQNTLVVYLQVDEAAIAERVKHATEHREEAWGEYVKTKGNSFDEIAAYYGDQQRNQLTLLKQSKLQSRVFDTTQHEYQTIANQIVDGWL